MNRFSYDNIDLSVTGKQRENALRPKGINSKMSPIRRAAKAARYAANADSRLIKSKGE